MQNIFWYTDKLLRIPLLLPSPLRAITIWEEIQKRIIKQCTYKIDTKKEANRLRAKTFGIKKIKERLLNLE